MQKRRPRDGSPAGNGPDAARPADHESCKEFIMATITGNNRHNEIEGTRFSDLIRGLGGNDELEGNGGDDTVDGGSGSDEIDGDNGDDLLLGRDGNDHIDGGSGSDRLYGGAGRDRLDGDSGNDRLWGGSGYDIFEFERGDGRDVIQDFADGFDRIDLDDFDFRSASQALSYADQVGDHVRFDFGAGGTLLLVDVAIGQLGGADFIL
jgi:Ca2+-binding RTX toxin-like protein